jgi:CBS domain-containing protein
MQVREVMTPNVDWVPPDTPVQEAAKRMRDDNVGALPIGENDKLIGMVTDRDIVVRLLSEGRDIGSATVRDAMSDKLLYCFEDEDIESVAGNMGDNHVRRLPVVNSDKRLVGMISLGDIARSGAERAAGEALRQASEPRT